MNSNITSFVEFQDNSFDNREQIWVYILTELNNLTSLILDNKQGDTIKTQRVKVTLAKLGHKLNNRVYANKLTDDQVLEIGNGFKNTEWLFDIHWYTECEWEKKRPKDRSVNFSGIKYDFQKLLMTNALLRVMIFRLSNNEEMYEIEAYFKSAIKCFKQLEKGAHFMFVCYNKKANKMFYFKTTS